MAHATKDKEILLNRVNRIKSQVNAIEKALEGGDDCSRVRTENFILEKHVGIGVVLPGALTEFMDTDVLVAAF